MSLTWTERMVLAAARIGPLPAHIGFIMDGNRRFARKHDAESIMGHRCGFDKLNQILAWCLQLGVTCITVFAFSLENFKRSEEEVSSLLSLAEEKFVDVFWHEEFLIEKGIRVRVAGDCKYLPPSLRQAVYDICEKTSNCRHACLIVCLGYTSTHEICTSIRKTVSFINNDINIINIQNNEYFDKNINNKEIEKILLNNIYTVGSPPLSLILRTSGETRLSDFLLLQCTNSSAQVQFLRCLWPEVQLTHLLVALFKYKLIKLVM
eukprot:GHVR01080475.1.p1 GENE.GHVR01080475.1~~GHVR01080475.1.p1  ORF type:complete len:264 (+),score=57.64 GHVR01080475.1:50-841(+)